MPNMKMSAPNRKIILYKGLCEIRSSDEFFKLDTEIYIEWLPDNLIKVKLKDVPLTVTHPPYNRFIIIGPDFMVNDFRIIRSVGLEKVDIIAIIRGYFKRGKLKPNHKIYRIDFSLFNFIDYFGDNVYLFTKNIFNFNKTPVVFESDEYTIQIYKVYLGNDQVKLLQDQGGYLLTHNCSVDFKQGINIEKYEFFVKMTGLFFSFMNGRRCFPNIIRIYQKSEIVIQTDCTLRLLDIDKYVQSWVPFHIDSNFNELWKSFLSICDKPFDCERIDLIIHWYLEALNNSAFTKGSIILIQNAYEMLFNWMFLDGKDQENSKKLDRKKASDKLRLLFKKFNINNDLPEMYQDQFADEIKKDPTLKDFAYQFTEYRNYYVHFKESKKLKLANRNNEFSWALLNTSIHNLEKILLSLLHYKGKMKSRVSYTQSGELEEIQL